MRTFALVYIAMALAVISLNPAAVQADTTLSNSKSLVAQATEDSRVKGNPRHDPNNDANGPRSSEPRSDATPDASTPDAEHSNSKPPSSIPTAQAPSSGTSTANRANCDEGMPMKLSETPATNYKEKGVRTSAQGKSLNQIKDEHHAMRDQMAANCPPKK